MRSPGKEPGKRGSVSQPVRGMASLADGKELGEISPGQEQTEQHHGAEASAGAR